MTTIRKLSRSRQDRTRHAVPAEHRANHYRAMAAAGDKAALHRALTAEDNDDLRHLMRQLLLQDVMSTPSVSDHPQAPAPASVVTRLIARRNAFSGWVATRSFQQQVSAWAAPTSISRSVELRHPRQIRSGANLVVRPGTILAGRSRTHAHGLVLGPDTYIKENCYLDAYWGNIQLAGAVAIGQNCVFDGGGGITVGRNVMFGAHCYLISSTHRTNPGPIPYLFQGDKSSYGVKIGDDVFIGGGSILLDGADIGSHSVIAAGSIVTRPIPPYSIYADRAPKLLPGALDRATFRQEE